MFEEHIFGVSHIKKWYSRIYGGIDSLGDDNTDSTCGLSCGPTDQAFITSIGLHYLADAAFEAKYYASKPEPQAHCPAAQPHPYGDPARGEFCCSAKPVPTPPTEGCPKGASYCCLAAGSTDGCQGAKPCAKTTRATVGPSVQGMPKVLKNVPLVYVAVDDDADVLEASPVSVCKPLPDELVIRPGTYCWVNQSWDMPHNGVARFAFWCSLPNPACTAEQMIITQQRIVSDGTNTTALLSSIAWLSSTGALDLGASSAELSAAALTRKLSTDSAGLANLAVSLMAPTHTVRAATITAADRAGMARKFGRAEQTLLEVHESDAWVAYDLDNDAQPLIDGKPASAAALRSALRSQAAGSLSFSSLAGDTSQDNTGLMAHDRNITAPGEPFPLGRVFSQELLRANLTRFYEALAEGGK